MVPEIRSATDRTFCHFGPLFEPPPPPPPNDQENQNFEKMKKTPGDIIILHMCTINDNHMTYGYGMVPEIWRQNFLSFWIILLKCTKNHDHMLHCS